MALLLPPTGSAGAQEGAHFLPPQQAVPAIDSPSALLPASGRHPSAAELLADFERRLLDEASGADIERITLELERLEAAALPSLRFRQRAAWDFGDLVELELGTTLTWEISDPQGDAQMALVAKRLELAKHHDGVQRSSRLREFQRSLRLLAHLEEVELLLSRHRRQLLALRPHWLGLERQLSSFVSGSGPAEVAGGGRGRGTEPGAGFGAEQIAFLEVVQALERTRRERSLLLLSLARRTGFDPAELEPSPLGRPPLPEAAPLLAGCMENGSFETDETVRAELLFEEALLAVRADSARSQPKVTLELSANGRYRNSTFSRPLNADSRLALRVSLPAGSDASGQISLAATPAGLSQEANVAWPAATAATGDGTDAAARNHRHTRERARIDVLRRLAGLQEARDRFRLRRLELAVAKRSLDSRDGQIELLGASAQAELALLNAALEVDLALIEIASDCGRGAAGGD